MSMNRKSPLFYVALLLALLAADIFTTVWFTRLGMAEANYLLAPLAGSVWMQAIFKAPFALALITGTFLCSASCDLLRPGSGKYPWLAVLAVYTLPPVYNLVQITQHVAGAFG